MAPGDKFTSTFTTLGLKFIVKTEGPSQKNKGKRVYLNDSTTRHLMKDNKFFEYKAEVPRIRVRKRQNIETLFNEEALLLAKFLRDERERRLPRICDITKLSQI